MAYNPQRQAVTSNSIQHREHHVLKTHQVYFELNISAFKYLSDTCRCQSDGRKHLSEIPNKIYKAAIWTAMLSIITDLHFLTLEADSVA